MYEDGLGKTGGAVSVRLALVRVERARGHADRAIALVDEVLSTAQFKADWLLVRADAYEALGQKREASRDRASALVESTEKLSRKPTDLARLTRARALLALGRRDEALVEIERVREKPGHVSEADDLFAAASGKTPADPLPVRRGSR